MRLLRRNVSLSETDFVDLHVHQGTVVGVLTHDGTSCQVLVDPTGRPVSNGVRTTTTSTNCATSYLEARLSGGGSNSSSGGAGGAVPRVPPDPAAELSPHDKKLLEMYVKYALVAIGGVMLLRFLMSTMLILVVVPLSYFYLVSTCPSMDSFDGKRQLKRVLRGHSSSSPPPDRPQGWMEAWTARLTASVTTELATLPGYSVDMTPLGGGAGGPAVIWTCMTVPTANLQWYWIGANHRWYYVGSRELSSSEPTRPHHE
jgi:hypothetical protein